MTTDYDVSEKEVADLDQMMSFGGKSTFEAEPKAVVPDNWYWCRLVRIGKPFVKQNPRNGKDVTKAAFDFCILNEADKKNEAVGSEFAGGQITTFINVEGWGDKSTMKPLCDALFGRDSNEVIAEQGHPILPSQMLKQECWVRVSTTANEKGEFTSWPQEFRDKLPKIQFGVGGAASKPAGNVVPMKPAAAPAQGKSPF